MSDHLPAEIWRQIFLRLPIKSLVKCSFVCRAWKFLITENAFICYHLTNTIQASKNKDSLFLQLYAATKNLPDENLEYNEFYSLYSSDKEEPSHLPILRFPLTHQIRLFRYSTVVDTCNGLVCFADCSVLDGATQIIWNPSLRKYVVLPKPSVTFKKGHRIDQMYRVIYGFGFDSRNEDFKLIRLVTLRGKQATPQVEVYSLASGSWRSITAPVPSFCFKHVWDVERTPQMFLHGVLHWVVSRTSNGRINYFILTFDVSEERFGELMLPQDLEESPFSVSILGGGDSLAVFCSKGSHLEDKFFSIWMMKEYGAVESWTEVFDSTSTQYRGILGVLGLISSGEVVLESSRDGIVSLDPQKALVKKLGLKGFFKAFVGHHVESLFLIKKGSDVLSY